LNESAAIAMLDGISGIFNTPDVMIIAPYIGYLLHRSSAPPNRWNDFTAINMVSGMREKN
jgi:hypothetical protein